MKSQQYQALLFLKNSAEGKPVEVSVENDSLTVYSSAENISMPLSGTEFKLGGDNNSYLIATDKEMSLFIKDNKIFDELVDKVDTLPQLKEKQRRSKHGTKITMAWLLSATAIFLLASYITFQGFIYVLSKNFPVSWEEKIGNIAVIESVKGKSASDKSLVQAVETIGNYLHENSGNKEYKIKFYVVKDKTLNAFALPGGFVVVNTGLLEKSDSPEEVAGVLAHELQHVYQKHGVERIIQRFGLTVVLNVMFGDFGGVIGLGGELAGLKFDRGEESEADTLGLDLLYKSGIDPEQMVNFFKKLQEIDKGLPDALSFFSTHPSTGDRIKNLQQLIKTKYNKPAWKKFDLNWNDIKEKAKKE